MKKIFSIIVALCAMAIVTKASAQELTLGVRGGVSIVGVGVYGDDTEGKSYLKSMRIGGVLGLTGEYKLKNERLSFIGDILFSQQGVKYKFDEVNDENYKIIYNFSYINVPIVFNYYFIRDFPLSFFVGVQPGYLLFANSKEKWSGAYSDKERTNCKDEFYSFDLGIPMGFSYDYSERIKFDARFCVGILNTYKGPYDFDKDFRTANKTVTFSAAYMF